MAVRRGNRRSQEHNSASNIMDDNIDKGIGRGLSDLLGSWPGKYIDILHSIYAQIKWWSLIAVKCFTFPFDTND